MLSGSLLRTSWTERAERLLRMVNARALLLDVAETAGDSAARAFVVGPLNSNMRYTTYGQPPADWRDHPVARAQPRPRPSGRQNDLRSNG